MHVLVPLPTGGGADVKMLIHCMADDHAYMKLNTFPRHYPSLSIANSVVFS